MIIIFSDINEKDGYYRQRPGCPPYLCLDNKYKGDANAILDILTHLVEADRVLYPAQKLNKPTTLFLEKGKLTKFVGDWSVPPLRHPVTQVRPMLSEICAN